MMNALWVRYLEDHFGSCKQQSACGICRAWAEHVGREERRRKNALWASGWVMAGGAFVIAIFWVLAH
jgi:hypothetical protein